MPQSQPQLNSTDKKLLSDVELGLEIEIAFGTAIGKYVLAQAHSEVEEAMQELKTIDPEDAKAIRAIQFKIQVPERLLHWLGDAIMSGKNAEHRLNQADYPD